MKSLWGAGRMEIIKIALTGKGLHMSKSCVSSIIWSENLYRIHRSMLHCTKNKRMGTKSLREKNVSFI
jgi:hypothetical protein